MTPPEHSRARPWLAAGLLIAITFAVHANGFHGPFIFDDIPSIVENPTIRRLWPLTDPLTPPVAGGITVGGRPVLNLSLALNYAVSGLDVRSYHTVNLLIHTAQPRPTRSSPRRRGFAPLSCRADSL